MSRRLVVLTFLVAGAVAFTSRPTQGPPLPAGAADAEARLKASPRHAEWAVIKTSATDSVAAWVVFPERRDKAPVVVVIHEIFGLSNWIRAVADQLAADGFIAIAPDLLTMKRSGNLTSEWSGDSARAVIRTLKPEDVQRDISAVANYAMKLPAATQKYGVVGYCWGGAVSFAHAVHAEDLDAAVVFYGTSPSSDVLKTVRSPVLGFYGAEDARVNATIAPAESAMKALGKSYEPVILAGAGHGFLRAQNERDGAQAERAQANMSATKQSWPRMIAFFRKHLAS